ncbi:MULTISPECIES: ABC transporter ATP-binding protein [unclassified Microbulbifer]|uniref:ABC transporter ATP-binding protein n=1 Tax=unclassified Microbulbifer TaxID=2619833 RepID=UPI0027E4710C|nr:MULTISPECIES: ABC transporter ATP-binding protein [unclassified Microbulbifer]
MATEPGNTLRQLCWPEDQLEAALQALAHRAGLDSGETAPEEPGGSAPTADIDGRIQQGAQRIGLEVEAVSAGYTELSQLLTSAAPALVRLRFAGEDRFLALCDGGRRRLRLLTPQLETRRACTRDVIAQLTGDLEKPQRQRIRQLLENAGIAEGRRAGAARALLDESLAHESIGACWLLRQPPGLPLWRQMRQKGLHWKLAGLIASHACQYLLFLLGWWLIGVAVLAGRADPGWFAAWVLLLFTQIPFALLTTRLQGIVSVETGTLIKKRLLAAALRMAPGKIRHMGSGQMLSRVFDAENIESDALHGGFLILLAVVELGLMVPVLALAAGGAFHLATLAVFLLFAVALCRRQFLLRSRWTDRRLSLTHGLIEKMVGHRTRLAQQPPSDWHRGEDRELGGYLQSAIASDDAMTRLVALLPRSWLVLGIAGLIPAFAGGAQGGALAASLGGILLGYRAVLKGMHGFTNALNATIAWRNMRELFALEMAHAKTQSPIPSGRPPAERGQPLLYARGLRFKYPNKERPVLRDCGLSVATGDRILLQGTSGSGKSTLANLITGLHTPDDGLLLLHGYDRSSLGAHQWRRLVASAPQFHENHVLGESFLFNLLMGDCWPPRNESVQRAYVICRELGLEPLLQKMPAGMLQTVGEMGWQLSHGERSRLYIARALLQNAELVVLDESFAALDPENLRLAVDCVKKHARTLLVIAHP